MNNKKIFYISWKGEESGAFSKEEILEMLNLGKIGYLHKIRTKSSQWIPIKDTNLDEIETITLQKTGQFVEHKTDYFTMLMYATAGLSFLSLWILGVSIGLSVYAYLINDKKNAIISLILTIVISLSGYYFFDAIYPIISE